MQQQQAVRHHIHTHICANHRQAQAMQLLQLHQAQAISTLLQIKAHIPIRLRLLTQTAAARLRALALRFLLMQQHLQIILQSVQHQSNSAQQSSSQVRQQAALHLISTHISANQRAVLNGQQSRACQHLLPAHISQLVQSAISML